jgi:bacitracin synthase 3
MKVEASYHQERLWFIDRFESGNLYESSPVYHNIPLILEIDGTLDAKLLEQSIQAVINRHEALRTQIITLDNKPFQFINQNADFKLLVLNLDENADTKDSDNAMALALEEVKCPFLLDRESLIRGKLIRTEKAKFLLVIVIHHIIADKFSLEILAGEIFLHYEALLNNRLPQLPDLPIHYADFSQWQRGFSGEVLESLILFWKMKLHGKLQPLEIPVDRPRALVHIYRDARQSFSLPGKLGEKIKAFSEKEGVDHFIVLLTAFKVLLYRYSGQDEIIVGTALKNRNESGTERIIGPISNLVVIRSNFSRTSTFSEVLKELDKTVRDVCKYQALPFDKLVSELNPDKDMSRTALFDVLFQYEENLLQRMDLQNLKVRIIETNLGWGKYDLNVLLQQKEETISGIVVYNAEYYSDWRISYLIDHYIMILQGVLEETNQELSKIRLLTEKEKKRLLVDFNQTEAGYPKDKTIHQLFEEQAKRTPGYVALIGEKAQITNDKQQGTPQAGLNSTSDNVSLTYKELNEKAGQLAYLLIEKGVRSDTIVGLLLERSPDMIVSILAILKAGGAYMPIDPEYPEERITYMLKDSNARILLKKSEIRISKSETNSNDQNSNDQKKANSYNVLDFETLKFEFVSSFEFRASNLNSSNLAYIIYTSGTTGRPKGGMVEHVNVVRLFFNDRFQFDFGTSDVWTLFHSFCFDFSVWEMYGALLYGGRLIVISWMTARDTPGFLGLLGAKGATVLSQTPSAFYRLQDEELPQEKKNLRLRYVIFGGEALSPGKLKKWRERYPDTQLVNMYGITETTVHVTYKEITTKEIELNFSNIGKPIPTLTSYVMDENQKLSPLGFNNELYIGGAGVARGYLNRPELTMEKFIENPYKKDERLYRSGDLVRLLPDGDIEYLGRIDHQVKIRGYRIELGEIENCLLNIPGVKETVVLVREELENDKYICAYFVSEKEYGILELREYLSKKLPGYMIPSYFVQMDKIPLTSNGKVDRGALPGPKETSLREDVDYTLPSSVVEKKLVEIWEKVLGRNNIGINENFFMIGGDSIKSIQIISRLSSAGYKLEMKDLFQYPVISELATQVKKMTRIKDQSTITGTIPFTPIQRNFFNKSHIDPHHYNQAVMLYSKERADKEALKEVFSKIQEHHDALRITYKLNTENGEIVQIDHDLDYPLSLEEYDLRNRENCYEELQTKADGIQASIDPEKGPLMKLGLFNLDDGDRLLIVIHHLVIDGISWRILFEDIEKLYGQYIRGEKLVLPSKTDSFKLWSEKLLAFANNKTFLKEKAYWQKIESVNMPSIPKDFDVDDNFIKDTVSVSFTLSEEETGDLLTKVNKVFRTEINDILLTALGMGIKKTWGYDRILIALEGHGREAIFEEIDISRTVGWFTSVYPVLLDISYASDLGRQIKEIKETLRRILNKGIGHGILKYLTEEDYKKEINFKLNPQIIFNYLGQFDEDVKQMSYFEIARESAGNFISMENRKEYELDVNGMISQKRLLVTVTYNNTHFKPETMAALASNYQSELSRIIAFCSSKEKREFTPSDFTYKGLTIESVNRLMELYPDAEDIYTLTPMQEGMLFHSSLDDSSSSYFEQMSYRLEGELDISLVEKSLNEQFKRHDILRTVFLYDRERPVQVVLKERTVDFYYEDIRPIGQREEKEVFIDEFKQKDRIRSFDLGKDVLMRVAILRVDESEYEFTWSHHHILMDGWCLGILNNEFFEIYSSYLKNRPYQLPGVKPYRTYIQWLEKQDREESARYWENYLDSYEEQTGVPKTKISEEKNKSGYRNETITIELNKEKTAELNKLAGRNHATLNTVTQAVWGVLLGKYNGKEDVVFGAVVSGRPSEIEGVESMLGLFINTIPVRVRFEEKMKFYQLLQIVQKEALAGEPYHYHPLAEIQSRTALKQNLIDHLFIFENYPIAEQIEGYGREKNMRNKISLKLVNVEIFEQTNYDFNVALGGADRLSITFQYNGNVYDRDFVGRISKHFCVAVNQVIENQELEIGALTFLSEEEMSQLLYEFNDTEADYPKEKTIHRLFEEQVERTRDNIAVIGLSLGTKHLQSIGNADVSSSLIIQLSYWQLHEQSNLLAFLLQEKGVHPGSIVAIKVEHSLEMVVGLLGIFKAGAAYLPIEPDYPEARIKYMLNDSTATLLITNNDLEELPNLLTSRLPNFHLSLAASLAYTIYTSGSTGVPKGVMIEHRNVVRLVKNAGYIHYSMQDRLLPTGSVAFDISTFEVWSPLLNGVGLLLVSKEVILNAEMLKHVLLKYDITVLHLIPQLFNQIAAQDIGLFAGLRYFLIGGDLVKSGTVNRLRNAYPHLKIIHCYGPTENTTFSTTFQVDKDYDGGIPIGKPIGNSSVFIVDKYNHLQPVGVPGELWVGGAGLARGYLNNPELTFEKFINYKQIPNQKLQITCNEKTSSPYLPHATYSTNSTIYRTGDLARWLPDGSIDFLGRIDHQIKIRGFRVELGEIEKRLLNVSGVKEAVVLAREEDGGDKYICAYFVSDKEYEISGLREHLSKKMPDYMIPPYFVQVEKIPVTPNGKVDRRALPKPGLKVSESYTAPRNEIEKKLVELWSEILGRDALHALQLQTSLGIDDNFFELGGHSLKATILVSKIHKVFDVNVPLTEIFKTPRIRELAEYIKGKGKEFFISIKPVEEKEYYPLSSAQKRLYILQQMNIDGTAYNMPEIIPLPAVSDLEKIKETFKRVIKRHESLRTSFHMVNNTPVQKIHENVKFEIEGNNTKISEEMINHFIRPFDLSQAPLLRIGLVSHIDGDNLLLVDIHHIISDGFSHEILVKDFLALHEGEELIPLRIQYKDFSGWQNREKEEENFKSQERYWLEEFKGEIPVLELPTDYPRPVIQSFEGDSVNFEISAKETWALKTMALKKNSTLFMVLVAVVNVLLSKLSGQEEIIIGTPIAGRRHADLDKIIGMFVNTLTLRNYPARDRTFEEFLADVRERILMVFENHDYPFENLVEKVALERDLSRNPLFDIMFVLQNINTGSIAQDKESESKPIRPVRPGFPKEYENIVKTAQFDLTLNAMERNRGLIFSIQYCTKLFKKETIERFITYFKKIVSIIVKEPGIRLNEIVVLSKEEKNQILYVFNDTEAVYPKDKTIHRLFEDQVKQLPDFIAAIGPSLEYAYPLQLSYRELDKRADQWTYCLHHGGVQPEYIVGIMADRSVEMIIGIMGILKSGAAYLPIDHGYPKERIKYMLADSEAKILVTTGTLAEEVKKLRSWEGKDDLEICYLDSYISFPRLTSDCPSHPSNLAYVIYTSGTTGKPKGVMIEHRSLVNRINWMQKKYPINTNDTILQKTTFTFDVSLWEIFWWSTAGAKVCLLIPRGEKDPGIITQTVERNNVTTIHFVPSMLNVFLDYLKASGDEKKLSSLKQVITSGEALLFTHVERFNELLNKENSTILANLYGPTEATIDVSYFDCWEGREKETIPIGKPIHNIHLYIMDKSLHIQPVGISGELCISGIGLARGYLNRPELTAEKFFLRRPGTFLKKGSRTSKNFSPIYQTGDLTRWLPDGNIEFLGRIDQQVKIRGFRVELEEIENRLLKHDDIKEAVVMARTDGNHGQPYLCAYILSTEELEVSPLKEYLSIFLPEYMIPAYFVKLEKLPLNPNGKIDRKSLPEPREMALVDSTKYEAPGNEIEKKLVETWKSVLGKKEIGIHENFFMIGGDSIKAIQIIARMRKNGYKIEMNDIFQHRQISELAPLVRKTVRIAEQSVCTGVIPLTPIQEEFFSTNQIDIHHFNQAVILHSKEGFEEEIVRDVFRKIQEHHDVLRMTYRREQGKIIQTNHGLDYPLSLEEYDLRKRLDPAAALEARCNRIQASIDLEKGPLMKLGLFHMDDGDRLLIVIHHLVIDGVSWRILFEDIYTLFGHYQSAKKDEPPELPLKTDSFKYWSEKLQEYARSDEVLRQLPYWREIESTTAAPLPVDHQVEPDDLKIKHHIDFSIRLSEEETGKLLKEVHHAYNTEINDILLTALAMAINRWTNQENLVVNLEGHGREEIMEDIAISRTIGWFTSQFPVILQITQTDDKSGLFLSEIIKQNKERLRKIPNRGIGYGILRYLTPPDKKGILTFAHAPEISFNYLGQFGQENTREPGIFTISTLGMGNVISPGQPSPFLLNVTGMITENRFILAFNYNKYQYNKGTIEALARDYKKCLLEIMNHCLSREDTEKTPSDYGISTIDEKELGNVYEVLDDLFNG